ncbi:MAG: regulatory protein RecX [Deferribacterota bacterium]|nr:regulatory protein RecX [Deferribacterota bacterium]
MDNIYLRAKKYLYKILARRDYTKYELKLKLKNKFSLDEDSIDKIIKDLENNHLIDDKRYKNLFIENKIRNGYGLVYIKYTLYKKGIEASEEEIYNIASKNGYNFKDIMNDLLEKKNLKSVEKKYNFLIRRGFTAQEVKDILKEEIHNGSTFF